MCSNCYEDLSPKERLALGLGPRPGDQPPKPPRNDMTPEELLNYWEALAKALPPSVK